MTGGSTQARSVYIWVTEGTWRASVDAALNLAPAGAEFTLLHVTPAAVTDAARGAYLGLFGRGGRDPGAKVAELAAAAAADLLAELPTTRPRRQPAGGGRGPARVPL